MNRNAGWRCQTSPAQVADGFNHGSCRGDDVVDQHRRVCAPALHFGHRNDDVAVSASFFGQDHEGSIGPACHFPDPLQAFFVRPH
jgi:hypothetical protein